MCCDCAKREKAVGFDLAKEQKKCGDLDWKAWDSLKRKDYLHDKYRKKSVGGKEAKKKLAHQISRMGANRIGSARGKPEHKCGECGTASHNQRTCWKLADGRIGRHTRAVGMRSNPQSGNESPHWITSGSFY